MNSRLVVLTADIVAAFVENNEVAEGELPGLIRAVRRALADAIDQATPVVAQKPAVPIRQSVFPDYIVSLEDGRKFKSLKRYLFSRHGLTPAAYRAKWGLPYDYPMVAPNYSKQRSATAQGRGVGRKTGTGRGRR